ncbi:hypothetical protein BH09DEP1_BH09DEP1_8080 [soil metagenome]
MKKLFIVVFGMIWAQPQFCMQNPLALQLPLHPAAINSFLHAYASQRFCDLNGKEVFFSDFEDNSYVFSYAQVKDILGRAYQDLSRFNVLTPCPELKKDYRKALLSVYLELDPSVDYAKHQPELQANRIRYRNAWASGDVAQIKEALKLKLYFQMPD